MLKHRLDWWLEANGKLPSSQYGFRRNKSTTDAHAQLVIDIYEAFSKNKTVLGLFLDIAGAYDNVQLPILFDKMTEIGLPVKFNERILSFIRERKIMLRINGSIVDSKITRIGLPQGSVLSPILYMLYVADLESVLPSDVKVIQYADDICVYTCKKSVPQCQDALDSSMHAIDAWCARNGLSISENKSIVCPFNRNNRIELPNEMVLGSHRIPCDTKVRFLGLYMDRKLHWKWHINKLVEKAESHVNILRMVCRNKWGADPSIGLLYYRATIRSIIDYGAIFYGQARKTHLRSLDTLQHKCVRLCLGLLRSTPIDMLLAEAGEAPLRIRRAIATDKYLLKLIASKNKILHQICSLTIEVLTTKFWEKKVSPPLVDSFTSLANSQAEIYASSIPPVYGKNFSIYLETITTEFIDSQNCPPEINNRLFLANVKDKWPDSQLIYTDGSKTGENVGSAFYDQHSKFSASYKLPDKASIFTAELVAILQALKYIGNLSGMFFVVITDCRSAVLKLGKIRMKGLNNYLIIEILEIYAKLTVSGKKIILLWTAGHKGVAGNEVADSLAKKAAIDGERLQLKIPATDMMESTRKRSFEEWQASYTSSEKGNFYKSINPLIKRNPWFLTINEFRAFFVSIFRLRSNHAICGAYLHKIGLRSTDLCPTCDEPEDMEHVIMICPRYNMPRRKMMDELYGALPAPFSYRTLLQHQNAYPALYRFIMETENHCLVFYHRS